MVDTSLIVAIISAVVSLGSALLSSWTSLIRDYRERLSDQRARKRELAKQINKYTTPLLLSAQELETQLRLLLAMPVSPSELASTAGKDNLKAFSCFLLGHFLAWNHILRVKTMYLRMSQEKSHARLRQIMHLIDHELDKQYDGSSTRYATWPPRRLAMSESMVVSFPEKPEIEPRPMRWLEFQAHWNGQATQQQNEESPGMGLVYQSDDEFRTNFAWFCKAIEGILNSKGTGGEAKDQRVRRLQHLLVAFVGALGKTDPEEEEEGLVGPDQGRLCKSAKRCPCGLKGCEGKEGDPPEERMLIGKQESEDEKSVGGETN